jgi:hypothetical protein
MKDAKIDRRLAAKLLSYISGLALIAALVFAFWPKPAAESVVKAQNGQIEKLRASTQDAVAERDTLQAGNATRLWDKSIQDIGPSALDSITRLAKSRRLKLATFRPQKPVALEGVTELPFLFALEGPYPDVVAFVRDLEKPETKLSLTMLQFSATDGSTDRVTATMSIAAFAKETLKGGSNGKAL